MKNITENIVLVDEDVLKQQYKAIFNVETIKNIPTLERIEKDNVLYSPTENRFYKAKKLLENGVANTNSKDIEKIYIGDNKFDIDNLKKKLTNG